MLLPRRNTLLPQRAILTLPPPLEAVADLARLLFFQTAALSAQLAGQTERSTLFDLDGNGIRLEGRFPCLGRWQGRTQQLAAFRFSQSLA